MYNRTEKKQQNEKNNNSAATEFYYLRLKSATVKQTLVVPNAVLFRICHGRVHRLLALPNTRGTTHLLSENETGRQIADGRARSSVGSNWEEHTTVSVAFTKGTNSGIQKQSKTKATPTPKVQFEHEGNRGIASSLSVGGEEEQGAETFYLYSWCEGCDIYGHVNHMFAGFLIWYCRGVGVG